ncbi:unnamed protein product [Calypogeia fissa]
MSKRVLKKRPWLSSTIVMLVLSFFCCWTQRLEGTCLPRKGCSAALLYYSVEPGDDLTVFLTRFNTTEDDLKFFNVLNSRNISAIPAKESLRFGPFPCGCVNDQLSHNFAYIVKNNDTLGDIASKEFQDLSQPESIAQASGMASINAFIFPGETLQVPVPCFCGDPKVENWGLFTTYLTGPGDNRSTIASAFNTTETLLQLYNPSVDLNGNFPGGEIVFIPSTNGTNGVYPPFQNSTDDGSNSSSSHRGVLIICIGVLGGLALFLLLVVIWLSCILFRSRWKKAKKCNQNEVPESGMVPMSGPYSAVGPSGLLKFSGVGRSGMLKFAGESQVSGPLESGPLSSGPLGPSGPLGSGPLGPSGPLSTQNGRVLRSPSPLSGFTLDKSVEFSFEELAAATDNFSVANKIGEGGYGSVYLATLRGQQVAVKRMNVQATREFLSEMQILTHVHHTHLVQLIGYCTVDSLFLIYEYVENGPLDRHLHSPNGLPPLSWQARVQIALDAARGLEYIHEHTKPTYIHRDVKTSNILLDKKLRAKVSDFGLTKLTETGFSSVSISMSRPMRLVGTFGYMSPEYARYGDVSPKVDVYSFGVVLFEIISAKSAIVKTIDYSGDPRIPDKEDQRSLVAMFEEVLRDPYGKEALRELIDPALDGNYPLDSVWKMARLAADCTQENPELRPSMRTVVVALMTLSSTTPSWETGSLGSQITGIPSFMSGR